LPDFRGPEGFWRAYPPMKKLGLSFPSVSTPHWFTDDPSFAWGFWLHRYNLYSSTPAHDGFDIMKKWGETKLSKKGYFVFTSNVDGHFQKKNFPEDRIIECHGSVHWMQCYRGEQCSENIWPSSESLIGRSVDPLTFRAVGDLPTCPKCGKIARPNVLMFGDYGWIESRYLAQEENLTKFKKSIGSEDKVVVIEIGAGLAVPTVRFESELTDNSTLIRINLRDPGLPKGNHISLPMKGLEALQQIDEAIKHLSEQ